MPGLHVYIIYNNKAIVKHKIENYNNNPANNSGIFRNFHFLHYHHFFYSSESVLLDITYCITLTITSHRWLGEFAYV